MKHLRSLLPLCAALVLLTISSPPAAAQDIVTIYQPQISYVPQTVLRPQLTYAPQQYRRSWVINHECRRTGLIGLGILPYYRPRTSVSQILTPLPAYQTQPAPVSQ